MSLNFELEMARLETRAKFPALEVVVQDGSVYVNFGWSEAVVIEPELVPAGRIWHAEVLHWDQTHGVDAEMHIDTAPRLTDLLDKVDHFLRTQAAADAATQAIIDSMPEDL